jgi:hypothetical protein
MYSEAVTKIGLSAKDDKRHIWTDNTNTIAYVYGHFIHRNYGNNWKAMWTTGEG